MKYRTLRFSDIDENIFYYKDKYIYKTQDTIHGYILNHQFQILYKKISNTSAEIMDNNINKLILFYDEPPNMISQIKNLLENNINDFDETKFNSNYSKAIEMAEYLLIKNKEYLYPVQELIMGSGKSSTITPVICLYLIETLVNKNLLDYKKNYVEQCEYTIKNNDIYIVVPEFLVEQTYLTILTNLYPLCYNYVDICLHKYNQNGYINNAIKIIILSDTEYKIKFINLNISTNDCYMIYDEVDLLSEPMTCELNVINYEKKKNTKHKDNI